MKYVIPGHLFSRSHGLGFLSCLLILTGLYGCDSGDPATSTPIANEVAIFDANVEVVVPLPDVGGGDQGPTNDGIDVADIEIVEGAFGWPCTDGAVCESGLCVEGPTGQVCTETCVESCAPGWSCKPLANAGQDIIVVCVAIDARLCWPCGQ
ncbi:MAG: hypothetical protein ACI9OJ_004208 [Myxococcota bacterium]